MHITIFANGNWANEQFVYIPETVFSCFLYQAYVYRVLLSDILTYQNDIYGYIRIMTCLLSITIRCLVMSETFSFCNDIGIIDLVVLFHVFDVNIYHRHILSAICVWNVGLDIKTKILCLIYFYDIELDVLVIRFLYMHGFYPTAELLCTPISPLLDFSHSYIALFSTIQGTCFICSIF